VLPWLIRGQRLCSNASEIATGFLKSAAYQRTHKKTKRGGVVNTQDLPFPEQRGLVIPEQRGFVSLEHRGFTTPDQRGFTTEDILWALGIWSVILCLSPVIVFYMLMVA
jgi:hypothetical protein